MKVLHLINTSGYYGAEAMIIELAAEQVIMGCKTLICCIVDSDTELPELYVKAKDKGLDADLLVLTGTVFEQGAMLLAYANKNAVNVVHSHGYRPGILLSLQKKDSSLLYVRTLHGWTYTSYLSKMFIYTVLDVISLWRQDVCVAVSDKLRSLQIMKFAPGKRIQQIDNGISGFGSKSIEREELEDIQWRTLCNTTFVMGNIGRLSKEKDQGKLIQALSLMRSKGYSVSLVILGEGEERNMLTQLAKELKVDDYVHMPGYCENASRYMKCMDVLCLSSTTEGLPITILEAMREGLPVLSTDVGDISKLLDDGRGLLLDGDDVSEIQEKLCWLYDNRSDSMAMIKLAKQYFYINHTSKIMASRYISVYERYSSVPYE